MGARYAWMVTFRIFAEAGSLCSWLVVSEIWAKIIFSSTCDVKTGDYTGEIKWVSLRLKKAHFKNRTLAGLWSTAVGVKMLKWKMAG